MDKDRHRIDTANKEVVMEAYVMEAGAGNQLDIALQEISLAMLHVMIHQITLQR